MDLSPRKDEKWARRSIVFDEFEVRDAAGDTAKFEGYASVFDKPYTVNDYLGSFTETARAGAFTTTLRGKPDVVLLENHAGRPHAHTRAGSLMLAEDTKGLHVAADLNIARTDTRDMYLALRDKSYREMSFAFRDVAPTWNDDYTERDLVEVSLDRGDVAVVTYGASPNTEAAVRSALARMDADARARLFREATDAEDNAALAIIDQIKPLVAQLVTLEADAWAAGDDAVSELQTLMCLLGNLDWLETMTEDEGTDPMPMQMNAALLADWWAKRPAA